MRFKATECLLLVFSFAIFSVVYAAASPKVLSWEEAVALAASADQELQAARAEERALSHVYHGTFADWYPALQAYGQRSSYEYRLDVLKRDTTESAYGLQTKLNLFSGFGTWARNSASWSAFQTARADRQIVEMEILSELRRSYGQVLVLQRQIQFLQRTRDRRKFFAEVLRVKYRDGVEAKWSLDQANVEVEALDLEIEKRQEQIQSQKEALAIRLGLPPDFELRPLTFPSLEVITASAPAMNPRLRRLEYSIDQISFEKRESSSAFWPRIDASYKWEKLKQDPYDWANNDGWMISLTWDLFTGFSSVEDLRAQSERKSGLELDLNRQRQNIQADLDRWRRAYGVSLRLLKTKEAQLKVARARLDVVENQFRSARRTFAEWESAQNYLTSTEREIIQIESDLINELGELENALGVGLVAGGSR